MLTLHSYWMDHLFYACTYMKTTKLLFAILLQDHRHFINMSVLVCFLLVKHTKDLLKFSLHAGERLGPFPIHLVNWILVLFRIQVH